MQWACKVGEDPAKLPWVREYSVKTSRSEDPLKRARVIQEGSVAYMALDKSQGQRCTLLLLRKEPGVVYARRFRTWQRQGG